MVEKPHHYLLNPDDLNAILEICRHCLGPCPISPIPCTGCTSVVFCSTTCRQASLFNGVHQYECELDLYHLRTKSNSSSFRIFLAFLAILQCPVAELEEIDNTNLMQMESHNQTRSFEEELKYLSITVLILTLIRRTSYYHALGEANIMLNNLTDKELKVAQTIDRLLRVQNFNTHPILTTMQGIGRNRSLDKKDLEVGLSRIGDCINVVIGSNFNHSCNPNTLRISTVGTSLQTILIASRNIPKGITKYD